MNTTSLIQIADWCGGALLKGVPDTLVSTVSTDSRSLNAGDVFFALKGDNFDGHKFISEADSKGVSCVIVSDLSESTESCSCAVIHVRDVLVALQNLASGYRRSLKNTFVVGVTGSNGKTSTKDFLSNVLSVAGPVNATIGNLNNHIGLPLSILNTESQHQFAIYEMGMNHTGEIEILAEIANADAAVITNIGTAHIEYMETRDAIADEKACLAQSLPSSAFCVMPATDEYYSYVSSLVHCRMVSVGLENTDVKADNIFIGSGGRISFDLSRDGSGECYRVDLPVRGRHMVTNALLAAAVGFEKGIAGEAIAESLSKTVLTGGRMQEREINGINYLDDSYNANPDSMRAAIEVLVSSPESGRKVAVLGFMGELGEQEEKEHHSIGEVIQSAGVDLLVTVGDRAKAINPGAKGMVGNERNFENHKEASIFLADTLEQGDLVLVKGSRAAGMEKILEFLSK